MSTLIDTLKGHHVKILELLVDAQNAKITSDEGRKCLLKGKTLILAHLKKEDEELYPKMLENPSTKGIAEMFSNDMKDIAKLALDLFERIESNKIDLETSKILGKVIANLKMRISIEENSLYPEFEKLAS